MKAKQKFVKPVSDARVQAMARLLNRAYDTVEAQRVREENWFHVEIASDLTAAFGELLPEDRARVASLCPRAAVVFEKMGRIAAIAGKELQSLELAR